MNPWRKNACFDPEVQRQKAKADVSHEKGNVVNLMSITIKIGPFFS
jgi:hypothetical protein